MTTAEVPFRKFAVVGAGPVGCIVAAFLARGGHDVTLCDIVSELVQPAVDPGITIDGAEELTAKVSRGITRIDELADDPPEVIIITVKATVLPLIASAIQGFYREGMYVVSWQNGIDTELVLAENLGRQAVLRAVVNYGCGLAAPGRVHMAFHHPPHFLQELDPVSRPAAEAIARALTESGLATERTDRIVNMVWRKSIMNACMNPVCAVTGMTMAQVMRDPIIFQIVDLLIKEGIAVARANEIELGWDYYPYCINYLKSAGDHKPSMLMDIENRRRTEVDFINGKLVAYGDQAAVDTPYNRMIRALVKSLEPK
ncbi:MAG: 2-dehydropantoate 2-reductase [Deltaproteobacteria bacterium]|nr:2-dehydropantoate 2-reductase [Candidatus Anaeroferrophillacea bacterium]